MRRRGWRQGTKSRSATDGALRASFVGISHPFYGCTTLSCGTRSLRMTTCARLRTKCRMSKSNASYWARGGVLQRTCGSGDSGGRGRCPAHKREQNASMLPGFDDWVEDGGLDHVEVRSATAVVVTGRRNFCSASSPSLVFWVSPLTLLLAVAARGPSRSGRGRGPGAETRRAATAQHRERKHIAPVSPTPLV